MPLIRTILFSCLLMHLTKRPSISLAACHVGLKEGDFLFMENKARQPQHHPQTYVSRDWRRSCPVSRNYPQGQRSGSKQCDSSKLSQRRKTNDKYIILLRQTHFVSPTKHGQHIGTMISRRQRSHTFGITITFDRMHLFHSKFTEG